MAWMRCTLIVFQSSIKVSSGLQPSYAFSASLVSCKRSVIGKGIGVSVLCMSGRSTGILDMSSIKVVEAILGCPRDGHGRV